MLTAEVDAEKAARVAEEGTLNAESWAKHVLGTRINSWAPSQVLVLEAVLGGAGRGALRLERLSTEPCPARALGLRLICL